MKYFTLDELTRSETAKRRNIKNIPNEEQRLNLIALVGAVLDPLREKWGRPIIVTSGYRCVAVNKSVGGVTGSQHVKGEAADIVTNGTWCDNYALGRLIVAMGNFDQVIFENVGKGDLLPEWIHVSWKRTGDNRRNILKKVKGSKVYKRLTMQELGLCD